MGMTQETIRADPAARRAALLAVIAAALVGGVVIVWFLPWLSALVQQRAAEGRSIGLAVCITFASLVALLAAPVVFLGVRIVSSGRAAARAVRFPPPGARVLRDTRVLTGRAAELVGRVHAALGVALVLCGLALALLGAYALVLLT
jgi:hypothetical protein